MSEIEKTVGQLLVSNLGWIVIFILFILSSLFKIAKKEIDPLGALVGWIGKKLTKDVRTDVATLKQETSDKFQEIRTDRNAKVDELRNDYNQQIRNLREDLDGFEKRTNDSIDGMVSGTAKNCAELKKRMDDMEAAQQKSNDLQTIGQIRTHVLDFANSCYNHREHTRMEFENIIDENTRYKKLVEKYGIENDVYAEEYKYIMEIYHNCKTGGKFLNEKVAQSDRK